MNKQIKVINLLSLIVYSNNSNSFVIIGVKLFIKIRFKLA